ncbi:hypothetical protein [Streptomyces sp. NPDC001410]|uniref:hypothetical protein n=1 Tax=Streptomyces sp. NPDC001410 TaxID=3364574 RepID=UPI00368DA286
MTFLALALVAVQWLTTALGAAHLFRRHRQDQDALPRSLHLVAPSLLGVSMLPLAPLLAFHASAVLWGLWGAGCIAAALVHAAADAARDIPRTRTTTPAVRPGPTEPR